MTTDKNLYTGTNTLQQKGFQNVAKNLLLLAIGCSLLNAANAQMDKRLVQADEYFANGEYYTAAHLYGQFLQLSKTIKEPTGFPLNSKRNGAGATGKYANHLNILYKEAESFRLANYWKEASDLYLNCYQKDSSQFANALYWYAVCQRNLGNYAAAEESLNQFATNNSVDNAYQQLVQKERSNLAFIKNQLVRPDSVLFQVKKIETSFGNDKGVYAPVAAFGNSYFITSTQTDSVTKPGINPNHNRIFQSQLVGGNLQEIVQLAIDGLDASLNQGTASVSADGKYLYFTQWKKEKGSTISSIYYATKNNNNGWSNPVLLPSINKPGFNSKQPFCSADGKYLYFASDREGGAGNFDIWFAPVNSDGTTGEPVNAGPSINTADNEQAPYLHISSGTLVFASDRAPGMGGFDLFVAKAGGNNWNTAENMGYPVNSSRDDVYFFTASNENVLINALVSSDRGMECCLATYEVTKSPKKKMITGVVQECEGNAAVADAVIIMKDASGKTFTTTTDNNGRYVFALDNTVAGNQFFVQKELFKDKTSDITIDGSNETGWLVDTLYNATICLEKKIILKVENVVTVYFDYDRSTLRERSIQQLDSVYNILIENSTATIQVSGYTDGKGSAVYNKKLSDKRAKACADYLIEKGIDPARISFESFGSCCPVEMELINGRDNPNARELNRRALININRE